ncbi:MAG: acylphosphatase [Methyloprofundus sp.]|nr:acylphosphatase [Methyloprofundus sp.]
MQHLKIIIEGRVQGVSFRFYTQKTAKQLNITGTIRNHSDGYVEIQATGEQQNMQAFVQWCHQGPSLARVKTVTVTPITDTSPLHTHFIIIN